MIVRAPCGRGRCRAFALLMAIGPVGVADAQEVVIHWRDGRPISQGTLETVDRDGITWTTSEGLGQSARWPDLREVDGLEAVHRRLLDDGRDLWRATSRMERGEIERAAPIFERLAGRWSGEDSTRRREALAGLVRCRVREGKVADAVLAGLELMEADRAGVVALGLGRLADGWPIEAPLWALDGESEDAARLRVGLRRFAESRVVDEALAIEAALLGATTPIDAEATVPERSFAARCAALGSIETLPADRLLEMREGLLSAAGSTAEERWIHARIASALAADAREALRRRAVIEWLCIPARFPESVEAPLAFTAAAELASQLGDDDLAWRLSRAADRAAQTLRTSPVPRTLP